MMNQNQIRKMRQKQVRDLPFQNKAFNLTLLRNITRFPNMSTISEPKYNAVLAASTTSPQSLHQVARCHQRRDPGGIRADYPDGSCGEARHPVVLVN